MKRPMALSPRNLRFLQPLRFLFMFLGPGLLVMIGDNDAGGILTYSQTGATYGVMLFVPLIAILIPVAYIIQEMTVRLGAVTGRGHGELIFQKFGRFWGYFSLIDLIFGNVLTVVTEFIGISIALRFFHVSPYLGVPITALFTILLVLIFNYITVERVVLFISIFNFIFIPILIILHPHLATINHVFLHSGVSLSPSRALIFILIANIGTTIAPWMIFYQQSAVVDRGMTPAGIRAGRLDTLIGSLGMGIIATAITAIMALTFFANKVGTNNFGTAAYMVALDHYVGHVGVLLFAIGLFEAGLVASIIISLSSAWAVGEVFGWRHSVNNKPMQARGFYLIYIVTIIISAMLVLIPNLPLVLVSESAQVIATILMPPALCLMLLLLNDRELMGTYVNSRFLNIITGSLVGILLILSTILGLITMFPHIMG